jgi:hypothetical protein
MIQVIRVDEILQEIHAGTMGQDAVLPLSVSSLHKLACFRIEQ